MRATVLRIITLAMVSSMALSSCGQGCLKCNTAFDNCLLCDFVSNYVLSSENRCSIKTRERCQIMSPIGECLQCATGYYFDIGADACLEVPRINLVSNCQFYGGANSCQTCLEGYYLEGNQCLNVQHSITGCRAYSTPVRCAECDSGYVLHPSGNRCVSVSSSDCLFQNHLQCDSCAPGFALDYNFFIEGLFGKASIDRAQAVDFLTSAYIKGLPYSKLNTPCRPLEIDNCEEYESFTVCKKCANNYFLSDSGTACRAFPHPALPFCESYTYYNSCSRCVQGYLLAGPNNCQPVRPIVNCSRYSQTSAANVCTECVPGYYVTGNTCNERQNIIARCEIYSSTEDRCSKCEDSHTLTTDALACLRIIPSCVTYQSSNVSTTSLVCQTCADGFFYNTNSSICNRGDIPNCKTYQNNSSTNCLACSNGFYLEGGECKQHRQISKCVTYSGLVPNACSSCDNTSFIVTQNIGCGVIREVLSHCVEYESPTECKRCEERFYVSNGSCVAIPASENCLERASNQLCAKCEKGYLLVGGVCTLPLDFETKNCQEIQNDGLASAFVCNKCKRNTMAFDYKDQYICRKSSILGSSSIDNCLKYELIAGDYYCSLCAQGFFVSDSNTCVSNVTDDATKSVHLNYHGNPFGAGFLKRITISFDYYHNTPGGLQGCQYIVYANDHTRQCLQCKSGKLAIVNLGDQKSHYNPAVSNPSAFTPEWGYGYNTYKCEDIANPTYYPGGTATVPLNCETFINNGNDVYCKSCKRGFTGRVETHGGVNYQFCDIDIPDCNNEVTYGGLIFEYGNNPFDLDPLVYLSCHACFTLNKIPVMFGNTSGDIEAFGLHVSDNIPNAEADKNDNTVQCLEITPESFNYKPEQVTNKFIENCGVAKYNVDVAKMMGDLDDYNTSPLVCALCKPGYMPIRLNNIIVRCDPIENCRMRSSKQWFNTCGECRTGYTWFFDPDTYAIDFSRCVPTDDRNCLASLADDDTDLSATNVGYPKGRCAMCKRGYSFNLDYVCEALEAPLCRQGRFVKGTYMFNQNDTTYDAANLINKNHDGCHECETSYVAIRQSTELFACTDSSYVELGLFPEKSAYVKNCNHYSRIGTSVICRECMEGYISSSNGAFCVKQEVYPNCERVNASGDKCAQCQLGYVLVNEFCERPSILRCESYDAGLDYQKCNKCLDEYMLVKNKCVEGHVENCRMYNQNETCSVCKDNYLLVNLKNNRQACLLINEELNCRSVSTTKINATQELECSACKSGFAPTTNTQFFERYVCQNIKPVENCELYDKSASPSQSSFMCLRCSEQYYLRDNRCIARQNATPNCITYSTVNDFCSECDDGFYLSNDKECINFPRGIFGCINYKDEDTCEACDKHMYLSGSTCEEVVDRIPNCAYYSEASVCSKCEFNYFLQDNECIRAKALNCSTYLRIDRCETCPEGFGLQQVPETGVVDCMAIPDLNCRKSEHIYPFRCIECKPLFYRETGRCLAVEQPIEGCNLYDSPVSCARCDEGLILSLNGRVCMGAAQAGIKPYDNCVSNKITLRPQCNVCTFGKKLINGVCTDCKNNTRNSGCMYCGGDDDQLCNICMPGHYMNNEGRCFRNSATSSGVGAKDADSR